MKVIIRKRPTPRLPYALIHKTKNGSLERAAAGEVVLVAKNEQLPWNLRPFKTKPATLKTGDYQLQSNTSLVCIERKGQGLGDLIKCLGHDRDRFVRELERLREEFTYRWVIIEGSWVDICAGRYRGKLNPSSAIGTIAAWQVRYQIPFLFADSRPAAQALAIRLLANVVREYL